MKNKELLPHLFRTEYRKIISVLCARFGIEHLEIAEDIVSDTFLSATEIWSSKGLPENPTAWLYTVAKNRTKNHVKRHSLFAQKISPELRYTANKIEETELDLSNKNINDSQLAMIFTVCNPCISSEAQVALSLNLLCGFGVQEIADAFLTNKEVIYKRLKRAKEKLKVEKIEIRQPTSIEIDSRLDMVLTTLYLLFNEGYYSTSKNTTLRKDLCAEAMRLTDLLIDNDSTSKPAANALLSLMCFHSSRFEARMDEYDDIVLYDDQDTSLWNTDLIEKGIFYLNQASHGNEISKYHLEAGIAYWHTHKENDDQKWENILQLYNHLLQVEYSPMAALNRTYALAKVYGKSKAIVEAEKLKLTGSHFYFILLGNLYTAIDNAIALQHFQMAFTLATSSADKSVIAKHIDRLNYMRDEQF